MLEEYDVLEAANSVIEARLELLQDLFDLRKIQMDSRSRLICRCSSCRSLQELGLAWLRSVREQDSRTR